MKNEWRNFKEGNWCNKIDVRDFIQSNYTPYDKDESFLTGKTEKASNDIKDVCVLLRGIGQKVSSRCGGHIHIGADYLKNKNEYLKLIEIWSNAEKV